MTEQTSPNGQQEKSIEAMLLEKPTDRYKFAYAAIRWAKEIKQKENLPDPIRKLVPRALKDLLSGKVTLKAIEELPMKVKITPAPPPTPAPTLTLNVENNNNEEKGKKPESTEEEK